MRKNVQILIHQGAVNFIILLQKNAFNAMHNLLILKFIIYIYIQITSFWSVKNSDQYEDL